MKRPRSTSIHRHSGQTKGRQKFDSPWQKIIELYFQDFLQFFFPQIHQDINWTQGFEFLDKEFHRVIRTASSGTQLVDKLVKVWTVPGQETWVLIHIEVQSQKQSDFARRMYVYNYRIFDHYNKMVGSLAILGDMHPLWKPDSFCRQLWNCEVPFKFPIIKLIDYEQKWAMLKESRNPFATITMAHILALKTRHNNPDRFAYKLTIIRHLYKQGYERQNIRNLITFIDWILTLPAKLEQKIYQELAIYEEKSKMEYIPSFERIALKKGYKQGLEKGIEYSRLLLLESLKITLETKFGKKRYRSSRQCLS